MNKLLIAAALSATAVAGAAFAVQPPPPPAPAPAPMKPRADATGDRVVTRNEFLAQAAARFDRIDANRDGRIDRAERQAARGTKGGQHRGGPGAGMDDMPPPPAPAPRQ